MHRSGRRSCRFRWQIDRHWWIIHRRRNSPDVLNKRKTQSRQWNTRASQDSTVLWIITNCCVNNRFRRQNMEKGRRKSKKKTINQSWRDRAKTKCFLFFFFLEWDGIFRADRKAAGAVAGLSLTCAWLFQESIFRFVEFTEIHFRNGRGSRDQTGRGNGMASE